MNGITVVHFSPPLQLRKELVSSGKVSLYHVFSDSGRTSYWIKNDVDIEKNH